MKPLILAGKCQTSIQWLGIRKILKVEDLFIQAWDIQKEFTNTLGIGNIFWARCGGLQLAEKRSNN